MVLEIKTGEDICKHVLIIENSHGVGHEDSKEVNSEKWASVDSIWKFWKDFYHPETADCCEESLERFEALLKKELEEE